ncbi:hypothetical protein CHS0354_037751 [Potamilus streckersoni]|uniref:Uncharacterized protein n=1 Tax=Potamilus streckersoni TaxID=2493646 RepID=A0AAE0RTY8_9BIVA|nr:hypothetical protein CHS0354_037751 [Potamilus streckersoni]
MKKKKSARTNEVGKRPKPFERNTSAREYNGNKSVRKYEGNKRAGVEKEYKCGREYEGNRVASVVVGIRPSSRDDDAAPCFGALSAPSRVAEESDPCVTIFVALAAESILTYQRKTEARLYNENMSARVLQTTMLDSVKKTTEREYMKETREDMKEQFLCRKYSNVPEEKQRLDYIKKI